MLLDRVVGIANVPRLRISPEIVIAEVGLVPSTGAIRVSDDPDENQSERTSFQFLHFLGGDRGIVHCCAKQLRSWGAIFSCKWPILTSGAVVVQFESVYVDKLLEAHGKFSQRMEPFLGWREPLHVDSPLAGRTDRAKNESGTWWVRDNRLTCGSDPPFQLIITSTPNDVDRAGVLEPTEWPLIGYLEKSIDGSYLPTGVPSQVGNDLCCYSARSWDKVWNSIFAKNHWYPKLRLLMATTAIKEISPVRLSPERPNEIAVSRKGFTCADIGDGVLIKERETFEREYVPFVEYHFIRRALDFYRSYPHPSYNDGRFDPIIPVQIGGLQ